MRRVLVTGARGFIGRHVVPLLVDQGYEVHAVSSTRQVREASVTWHAVNLLDGDAVAELNKSVRATDLLHLAWITKPGEYWESAENLQWLEGSIRLLRSFAEEGGVRAVMAGTCAEYDWRYGYCVEEITPCQPVSLYGRCKEALWKVSEQYGANEDMAVAWGRVFFLYGPGEPPSRLVPYVIRSILEGAPAYCSSGAQVRDFMHVVDVASAFVALLNSDVTGAVNIASGIPITVRALATQIGELLDSVDVLRFKEGSDLPDEPPLVVGDKSRLMKELRWRPQYTLESGLADTIRWWRTQLEDVAK